MFEDHEATYKSAIAFYMTQRLFLGIWYGIVAWLVPMIKGTMFLQMFVIVLTSVLWVGSMHTEWPNQLALTWFAIFFDIFGGRVQRHVYHVVRAQWRRYHRRCYCAYEQMHKRGALALSGKGTGKCHISSIGD